jgi:hypothetical protein
MKRSFVVVGLIAAAGWSGSALAQQLEWVNGQGDATGHWQAAQYRIEHWRLVRADAGETATTATSRPALSYAQLAAESQSDVTWQPTQPRYQLEHGKMVLQNPTPATPRERVSMWAIERLYPDFSTG